VADAEAVTRHHRAAVLAQDGGLGGGPEPLGGEVRLDEGAARDIVGVAVEEHGAAAGSVDGRAGGIAGRIPDAIDPRSDLVGDGGGSDEWRELGLHPGPFRERRCVG